MYSVFCLTANIIDSSPGPLKNVVEEDKKVMMKKRPCEEEEEQQQQPTLAKRKRRLFQDFPRFDTPNIPCNPIEMECCCNSRRWVAHCIDEQEKTLNGFLRGKVDTIKSWNRAKELENYDEQLRKALKWLSGRY